MKKEQLIEIGKALANVVMQSVAWEEPLDGDETTEIAKAFLVELNSLSGNEPWN